jgi:hypothetical protein
MILTEKEAKKKWCPLVRVRSANGSYNVTRDTVRDEIKSRIKKLWQPQWYRDFKYQCYRCRASGCMSWRWVDAAHGFCGEFGAPDAGASAQNPRLLAPPADPPRTNGGKAGDRVLPFIVLVSTAVIVYFARQVWP